MSAHRVYTFQPIMTSILTTLFFQCVIFARNDSIKTFDFHYNFFSFAASRSHSISFQLHLLLL